MPKKMRLPRGQRRTWSPQAGPAGRRRAVAVLELVLALPLLIIPLLAILHFGLYYANMQQVALASRLGAEEASQTFGLEATNHGDPVPANVMEAVTDQLLTAGIENCQVRLEHNAGGSQVGLVSTAGTCDCNPTGNLTSPPPGKYVRLSVCVPTAELIPRCLSGFGFGIGAGSDGVACTTVFRYELSP